MKFLADECCETSVVDALRTDGHDVLYAMESMRGATDEDLLTRAFAEERILLTEDKDFGELVYRLGGLSCCASTSVIALSRFPGFERCWKLMRNDCPAHL